MTGASPIEPGLMVIHGNQPESLRELLVNWMRLHPLSPLERETVLVQSNGIAQWLKFALAADTDAGGLGVAAALSVELPAQFLWRAYRAALGPDAVPETSALDKSALAWRLMRLLPVLLERPAFGPLRRFLAQDRDMRRRHQLAERLADLFDQYQVYRADWLDDWARGRDQVRQARGGERALGEDERWQAELWRALLEDVGPEAAASGRAAVHERFLACMAAQTERPAGLPRRVAVFGISSLPAQSFAALQALARHSQVMLFVHNPSRHHWGDIVADKDLLRHSYKRQTHRPGTPSGLDEDAQHQHAQPLLAAWGKQGRDYLNLLDAADDPERYRGRLEPVNGGRIALFAGGRLDPLLGQLQDDILDLRPPAESRALWPAVPVAADASVRFHIAHSAQREVEVLHDQLLARFDADPALTPRDIIVMVPDINAYAPHIDAVFGQLPRADARHIPYTLADQGQRGREPLLVALEYLLKLPESRFAASEILDLLDVGAVRRRLALADADLPTVRRWIAGAGVRWGLDGAQREQIALPAAHDTNSWRFGLRRMLLGYAVGEGPSFEGIAPYGEIGGLDAVALGPLAALLERLDVHRQALAEPADPATWAQRLRDLVDAFFTPSDEAEELLRQQLLQMLDDWLATCQHAGFDDPIPLTVVRESWLAGLDQGGLNQRFLAGAVNFCTLLPMRAIPFKVVCLLGMNDGDYPRQQVGMDFDLMRQDYRPGDRSRREDDRYLMLEALLSAREQLYVSWVGRSIRDNSERPPSVLVAQLRDHLRDGWRATPDGTDLLHALTQEHPLQPFSAAYFPPRAAAGDAVHGLDGLYTYAHEWGAAQSPAASEQPAAQPEPLPEHLPEAPLRLRELADFLAQPVQAFFRSRLRAVLGQSEAASLDDEAFSLDALQTWQLQNELCLRLKPWVEQEWPAGPAADPSTHPGAHGPADAAAEARQAVASRLADELDRLAEQGQLPLAGFGPHAANTLAAPLTDLLARYRAQLERYDAGVLPVQELSVSAARTEPPGSGTPALALEDDVDGVRLSGWDAVGSQPPSARIQLVSGKLHEGRGYKWHSLVRHWVDHLALQAVAPQAATVLVSQTGDLVLAPLPAGEARALLADLLDAWAQGMREPLPVSCKSAFAWLAAGPEPERRLRDAATAYDGSFGLAGEAERSPELARAYPRFADLAATGAFEAWCDRLYRPLFDAIQGAPGEPADGDKPGDAA